MHYGRLGKHVSCGVLHVKVHNMLCCCVQIMLAKKLAEPLKQLQVGLMLD